MLLRLQDPGGVLRHMKAAAAAKHDRDALMEVPAFAFCVSAQPSARSNTLLQMLTTSSVAFADGIQSCWIDADEAD